MPHIFISYSHQDKTYAHNLASELEKRKFEVWIDDRIDYGEKWPDVIEQFLDSCTVFLIIMSPRSRKSTWVKNELTRAQRLKIPILPLLLEGKETWLALETIQYVDVRNGELPQEKFFSTLEKSIPRKETTKGQDKTFNTAQFLCYSTQALISHLVSQRYFGNIFSVYCTEQFDASIPQSPLGTWRVLNDIVKHGDTRDPHFYSIKRTIKTIAQSKYQQGLITQNDHKYIKQILLSAVPNMFTPLIYLIDRQSVNQRLKIIPNQGQPTSANLYFIEDLMPNEFDILDFSPLTFNFSQYK